MVLDANGDPLPDRPTLAPGAEATVVAKGFEPGESVTVTVDGEDDTTLTADDDGVVVYDFQVPDDQADGEVEPTLAGATHTVTVTLDVSADATSTSSGSASGSGTQEGAGTGSGDVGGSGGSLPRTGSEIAPVLGLALGLLLLGGTATHLARRRPNLQGAHR
ncbi:hypothetical protein GCM10025868_19390 [Angustibacter aerolatus]|uniref:Gram-positive cocci surface proteins LPxTG domain-containing protein n=1 Tax=Angustibacter aerolatus TaxID=1162965 RepID=A0ABQ6JHV0_9ACTN|nr:LPXTG cell wall anchor domain-containing protein [Angustibacter aerolatus]GMA86689.1 hypothetical protein GCM10025868_19390 [Angustibacter aerolatus]